MIVVDVETTGTEASRASLVSIGAVDLGNPARTFHEECRIWDGADVSPEALAINGFTQEQIIDPKKQGEGELVSRFLKWAAESDEYTVAGLNPYFDIDFIKWAAIRQGIVPSISWRTVDLHSVCYMHMIKRGVVPPTIDKKTSLGGDKIMPYVGLPLEPKPHIALNGALWEAEAFSRLLYGKMLLPQFENYPIPWNNGRT